MAGSAAVRLAYSPDLRYAGHADGALGASWLKCRVSPYEGGIRSPSTPPEVADRLDRAQALRYGRIGWDKFSGLFPEVTHELILAPTGTALEAALQAGAVLVARVYYRGKGVQHWVVIVGAMRGQFLIVDPALKEPNLLDLGVHGRVFAVHAIRPRVPEIGAGAVLKSRVSPHRDGI